MDYPVAAGKIYKIISSVQEELSKIGITKNKKNEQQGYKFRGIDDVLNCLAPVLAKYKLCILPRCTERICTERTTSRGTSIFYVTVKVEYDFVAEDGSKHTVVTYGEAMDSADKATNKAMSAAYKYAAFQTFCIPTEETSVDADSVTPEAVLSAEKYKKVDMEAMKAKIFTSRSIDEIKEKLKYAVDSGATSDDIEELRKVATERKKIIQQVMSDD
jgi:hypothetical protein